MMECIYNGVLLANDSHIVNRYMMQVNEICVSVFALKLQFICSVVKMLLIFHK